MIRAVLDYKEETIGDLQLRSHLQNGLWIYFAITGSVQSYGLFFMLAVTHMGEMPRSG